MDTGAHPEAKRIGVVAAEPMRLAGLESMYADDPAVQVVPLSAVAALRERDLSLIIVDASSVDQLFEMLDAFRRSRPRLKVVVLGPVQDHAYIQRVIGAGAKGYVTLIATLSEVAMALEVVLDGSIWAPRHHLVACCGSSASRTGRR